MKALTIRNIPQDLAQAVRRRALEQHTSLNKAILGLLGEMMGLSRKRKVQHHDLDHLFGRWAAARSRSFEKALASQRVIDRDLWK